MGEAGEGRNITHQQKSMNDEARLAIRDRLGLPLTDEQATGAFFHRPPEDSPELRYLLERRAALGGSLPARHTDADPLPTPAPFTTVLEGSGERENSTTMAFVRILNTLVRDPAMGERIVPIVPDESRTFGMEGMFRQLGIFSQVGPALPARGRRGLHVLPRGRARPDPAGGDQRARRVLLVDRRGDVVRESRRHDGAVLHLLFDVRLPARRRSRLGGGRQPRARLPHRRHRRPDDAERRRGSSTRTATRTCSRRSCRTAAPTTRPTATSWR